MSRRIGAADWGRTALGRPDVWPANLRMATATCLSSRFPMMIAWGPELTQIYNDAFIPIMGEKHPQLARQLSETWAEIFDVIGPMLRGVLDGAEAVYHEDALMWVDRLGFQEDTYFTFSFSPIADDDGTVGGVLITALETTARVLDARRFRALGELSATLARGPSAHAVVSAGVSALGAHTDDLPFALVYLRDPQTNELALAASAGAPAGWALAPAVLRALAAEAWPAEPVDPALVEVLEAQPVIHPLSQRPVRRARVMPLLERGLLVAGLSPARRIDDEYLGYLDLVAAALGRGITAADAYAAEHARADALVELDRAKTEFLQNVSHELRTPLTLIQAPVSDMIDDGHEPLAASQRRRAEIVQRNAERLARMVDGLLDFSRDSQAELKPEPTDLSKLTDQLVSAFHSAAERAGIALEVSCDPANAVVSVDRDAWERIVLNLVSNALKFTHAGVVRVSLRISAGEAALEVADTGVGIATEYHELVFERFGRVRQEAARSYEGVGIGLALVRQLARRLGGDVQLDSTLGNGSCFTVRIPARPSAAAAAKLLPSGAAAAVAAEVGSWGEAPTADLEACDRPLVLCADDSADMRQYIVGVLGGEYRVQTVGDGVDALAAARCERPDLVLTDVMMPRMGGLELVRALRCDPATATVPVVIFSARAGDEASAAGLETGADDYIVKPFSPRELRARVRTHVELVRSRALIAQAEHERGSHELIRASERRLRSVIAASGTGIALAGGDGFISDVNPALCQLLRRSESELKGMTLEEFTDPEDVPKLAHEHRWLATGRGDNVCFEARLVRGDGNPIWTTLELTVARDDDGSIAQFVTSIRDAGERRRDENRLRYLADHDALTGLLNRRRFGEELLRYEAECHRDGSEGAVVLLDLDGLGSINARRGHAFGDRLLCATADLVRCRMRETDVLARLGGDEFALLLPHAKGTAAEAIAHDLQHRIRQGAAVLLDERNPADGDAAQLSASVGIALISGTAPWKNAEEILAEADGALFIAKQAGAGNIRMASVPLGREARRIRLRSAERIRGALAADRFELFAQPIVGLCADDRPRYELLLRLRGEAGEVLGPGTFLPDAERSNLILEIDRWVISHSIRVLRDWRQQRGPVTLHVNLSAGTVTSESAANLIAEEIQHARVDGRGLVFEITETTAITSLDRAHEFAARMRQLGCGLALDDFGSGFASFAYLKNLDYDYVKLDGNLVEGVACNIRDQRILNCIAELTRGMGKRVIAECVADDRTLQQVRELGIDYAQGFHLGVPAPIALAVRAVA